MLFNFLASREVNCFNIMNSNKKIKNTYIFETLSWNVFNIMQLICLVYYIR